jgi:predicted lipoprotein with Yx(FWY)xxD motif
MENTQVATSGGWLRPALRIVGAGLLAATAAIHLDLYLTGFRNIPTIGWLFLLQVIAGFALAALVLATGNRVAAALGAGFAVATLGGYLLSIWFGLFGFKEVRTTAGIVAGLIEIAAFAVLGLLAVAPAPADQAADGGGEDLIQRLGRMLAGLPMAKPAIAALSGLALVLLVVAVAGASGPAPSTGPVVIKIGKVGGVSVLTNAKGLTVYMFAADSPGKSNCYSSCSAYWPPVTGTASHAPGIPGTFGTTTRTDGAKQVTWNGHPLYTYVADGGPGQDKGNNLNLNGGLWKVVVVSG